MNILNTNYAKRQNINFGAASDITLEYVMKNHAKYLPPSMLKEISSLVKTPSVDKPKLYELHNQVYKRLFDARSLDEVKSAYTEFSDVLDISTLKDNRSKAIKAVKETMPLEKFTLEYLKKLFSPTSQDELVKQFGFTNRSLLAWLNEKLNIKKLTGTYIKLLQMSDEKENNRISSLSRKALFADPKVQKFRLERAAEAHRTAEYREKKRQEMVSFYKRNPEMAEKVGIISQRTWDSCPEIKEAMSEFVKTLSPFERKVISKKRSEQTLSDEEKRIAKSFYKKFWETHPELKELYKVRRLEIARNS